MHHKLSFRRKLQAFFLSLLLVLLTTAGVPSAAYTAEAASADTTMAVHFLDVGQYRDDLWKTCAGLPEYGQ